MYKIIKLYDYISGFWAVPPLAPPLGTSLLRDNKMEENENGEVDLCSLKKMNFLKFPYLSIFYGLYLSCTSFTPTTCRFVLMFRPCLLWLHLVYFYLRHCLVSFNYPLLVLHKTPKGVIWLIMLVTILNSVRRLMRFLLSNSKYCIFSLQIWKLIEQCLTPNHRTPPI